MNKGQEQAWSGSPNNIRNRIARILADAVMRYIADDHYERFVEATTKYGIRSHVRDMCDGCEPPPTFEELGLRNYGRFNDE